MKSIFFPLAVSLTGVILACSCSNDEPGPNGNYGDPGIKPDIRIESFYSKANPANVYRLEVDPNEPTDTTYEEPAMTAKYVVYKPVMVPCEIDTFIMRVNTNSRWTASTPTKTGLFIINNAGGGDTDATFRCTRNSSTKNDRTRYMYFYTNDSSVMHKVTIVQSKVVAE